MNEVFFISGLKAQFKNKNCIEQKCCGIQGIYSLSPTLLNVVHSCFLPPDYFVTYLLGVL